MTAAKKVLAALAFALVSVPALAEEPAETPATQPADTVAPAPPDTSGTAQPKSAQDTVATAQDTVAARADTSAEAPDTTRATEKPGYVQGYAEGMQAGRAYSASGWMWSTCATTLFLTPVGGATAWAVSLFKNPKPPPSPKTSEKFTRGFNAGYRKTAKPKQSKAAAIGCAIGSIPYAVAMTVLVFGTTSSCLSSGCVIAPDLSGCVSGFSGCSSSGCSSGSSGCGSSSSGCSSGGTGATPTVAGLVSSLVGASAHDARCRHGDAVDPALVRELAGGR